MKISPFIFVLIKNGCLVLWDYKLHNQYEITNDHLNELLSFERTQIPSDLTTFTELIKNKIIVKKDDPDYDDSDWKWDDLAKIYHIGTQDLSADGVLPSSEYAANYLKDCEQKFSRTSIVHYSRMGKRIKLPRLLSHDIENAKLIDTLENRATSRNFNGSSISLENVSSLLKVTFANSNRDNKTYRSVGLMRVGQRKTSPSGGGLHPSEAYLLAKNINGLEKGVYHYNSEECNLTRIRTSTHELDFGKLLNGQYFADGLSAGIFITSVFEKQWWKYKHSRAYRIALIDVGHLSQTLLLTATAAGLSTWVSGAFDDSKVSKLLRIKSIAEKPILFIGIGYGNGSPIDPETLKLLNKTEL